VPPRRRAPWQRRPAGAACGTPSGFLVHAVLPRSGTGVVGVTCRCSFPPGSRGSRACGMPTQAVARPRTAPLIVASITGHLGGPGAADRDRVTGSDGVIGGGIAPTRDRSGSAGGGRQSSADRPACRFPLPAGNRGAQPRVAPGRPGRNRRRDPRRRWQQAGITPGTSRFEANCVCGLAGWVGSQRDRTAARACGNRIHSAQLAAIQICSSAVMPGQSRRSLPSGATRLGQCCAPVWSMTQMPAASPAAGSG
jgi:hypothetical protein